MENKDKKEVFKMNTGKEMMDNLKNKVKDKNKSKEEKNVGIGGR